MTTRFVIEGAAVATCDADGTEHASGFVVVEGNRIVAVGAGAAPVYDDGVDTRTISGLGCLATPGLVNTHHHLYQWLTRGMFADATLFDWLVGLYPVWSEIDAELEYAAARGALAQLALSGCTTTMDHHYVFPRLGGDLLAAEVEAATSIGLRFHPTRGSMDRGHSHGGLPPDVVVEEIDAILEATDSAIDRFHDPSPDAMVQVGVAPCSPFSVSRRLMTESADLARRRGVRLHTHLAETLDEEEHCLEQFGRTPVDYLDEIGWLGDDVWLAHCVHLSDDAVARLGASGTGVAHCPSSNGRLGAGIAPAADLIAAGSPVGLGVDGAASQETGQLGPELRQALYAARLRGGPGALTARTTLRMATIDGARCLGRSGHIGSLETGKLADVALWRLDGLGHSGITDPVTALVLGPPAPVAILMVNGRVVVDEGVLATAEVGQVAAEAAAASRTLAERAGITP
ncbi:MAG: 8-oxoguanine deaminase [Mycobacteriales bacterium]